MHVNQKLHTEKLNNVNVLSYVLQGLCKTGFLRQTNKNVLVGLGNDTVYIYIERDLKKLHMNLIHNATDRKNSAIFYYKKCSNMHCCE